MSHRPKKRLINVHILLALLLFVSPGVSSAGTMGNCHDLDNWTHKSKKKITEGTKAYTSDDLTEQLKDAGMTENGHKFVLGGKGAAKVIGITVGDGKDGLCTNGDNCMKYCQALCCLADGCELANLHRDKDGDNYVVYSSETTVFSCKVWKDDDKIKKDKEEWSLCNLTGDRRETCGDLIPWFTNKLGS